MSAMSFALCRAYSRNIDRYQRLLRTDLTDIERRYVEGRLSQEQTALEPLNQPLPDN